MLQKSDRDRWTLEQLSAALITAETDKNTYWVTGGTPSNDGTYYKAHVLVNPPGPDPGTDYFPEFVKEAGSWHRVLSSEEGAGINEWLAKAG
jgi:hypothetical protein